MGMTHHTLSSCRVKRPVSHDGVYGLWSRTVHMSMVMMRSRTRAHAVPMIMARDDGRTSQHRPYSGTILESMHRTYEHEPYLWWRFVMSGRTNKYGPYLGAVLESTGRTYEHWPYLWLHSVMTGHGNKYGSCSRVLPSNTGRTFIDMVRCMITGRNCKYGPYSHWCSRVRPLTMGMGIIYYRLPYSAGMFLVAIWSVFVKQRLTG